MKKVRKLEAKVHSISEFKSSLKFIKFKKSKWKKYTTPKVHPISEFK